MAAVFDAIKGDCEVTPKTVADAGEGCNIEIIDKI